MDEEKLFEYQTRDTVHVEGLIIDLLKEYDVELEVGIAALSGIIATSAVAANLPRSILKNVIYSILETYDEIMDDDD